MVPVKLYKSFESVLDEMGPFQGTIIVSVDDGKCPISEQLKQAIIKLINDFCKISGYRFVLFTHV